MTQEAIQEIIRKQRNYFYTGATLNIDFRITALKKLQTSIQSHQEQINAALKSDLGKSSFESYMCESGLVLSEITYMLKHIRSLSREKTVHTPLAQFHSRSYMKPSPYGVTLIMSPWNYPFLLTFDPLVDAIAVNVFRKSMWPLLWVDARKTPAFSKSTLTTSFSPAARLLEKRSCAMPASTSLQSPWSLVEKAHAL